VDHKEEALRGGLEPMILELRELQHYALAGRDIYEAATEGSGDLLPQHDPVPWVEAAV
jgi:hypothetical protein